ncbi:hypothetical protein F4781DRAFT_150707 [Annulohypoxylon bovei var. microspora]|nr:hypothetical protein F4781DRAFT_150707 [Annulohypoxylon bovei var. microspora]
MTQSPSTLYTMSKSSGTMNPSQNIHTLRCTYSDGKQYDETRFPAEHKLADEATLRNYCNRMGALLGDQLFPGDSQTFFTLDALPEHYHLRVKARVESKTRQDVYLYGYPDSEDEKKAPRKQPGLKCFRSTNEFFDHIWWLVTDPTKNRQNCGCKFCKPSGGALEEAQSAAASSQAKSSPLPAHMTIGRSASPALAPAPNGSSRTSTKKTGATASKTKAAPSSLVPPAQPLARPGAQPAAKPAAQLEAQFAAQLSVQPQTVVQPMVQTQPDESALFREGEVVWYRKQGSTFRLGIILENIPGNPTTPTPTMSRIKPLGHFQTDLAHMERTNVDMRPFLTYSVPRVHDLLQGAVNKPMQEVDWLTLESELPIEPQSPYDESKKAELVSLEASKIAACRVDHSYSLFNCINPHTSFNQQSFRGVFFGCEKICIFEAVRVIVEQHEHPQWEDPELTFAMVVKNILLEKTEQGDQVFFQGDIWLLLETNSPQQAPDQDQLPPAMRREKEFRDEVKRPHGTRFDWILLRGNVTKSEKSIKGRFYESQKLGPMLYQNEWDDYLKSGVIPAIQKSLNKRLDSWGPDVGRVQTRRRAVDGAIAPGIPLALGPLVVEGY